MAKQTTGISFDVRTLKALREHSKRERRSISASVNWAVEVWLGLSSEQRQDLEVQTSESRRAPRLFKRSSR